MFPVRQPWLCKALGAFLYPISGNAFINKLDICSQLQHPHLYGRSAWGCCEISGGCFCLDASLGIAAWTLFCHCCLICFCCFLACWWGFIVRSWICRLSEPFFLAPRMRWKTPASWHRCAVWLFVRFVPPVCWYIMPLQVVMIAVSGALGQCPTRHWWPPCCAILAWHYFVAVDMKRWPKPKSLLRLTLPGMSRTTWSWPLCE